MADDLLVERGLVVAYGRPAAMFARRSVAPAVLYGIDIHVGKGETVGIVGESGSGKTTLGRALLGLVKPVAGSVIFDGRDITALDEKARRPLRRRMQMIFQDPMSSLNPPHTIGRILTEPVLLHGLAQDQHRDPAANEFRCKRRKTIILALGPTVFDRDVLPFDVSVSL